MLETTLAWVADDVHMAWPRFAAYSAAKSDIIKLSDETLRKDEIKPHP
jgi:hypothetical protein